MHRENHSPSDSSSDSLEAHLRGLPPPAVPADLEARLLNAIPQRRRRTRRPWIWGGSIVAAAAASLLVAVNWPRPSVITVTTTCPATRPMPPEGPQMALSPTPRTLDTSQIGRFAWPLEETKPLRASLSIPPDLLN
jgi:hypothetical protein